MDDSVKSSSISTRNPVIVGLRNALHTAVRHSITTITIPLLLFHEMTEVSMNRRHAISLLAKKLISFSEVSFSSPVWYCVHIGTSGCLFGVFAHSNGTFAPKTCLEVRFLLTSFLGLFPSLRESPRGRSWWYYHLKGSVSNHFLCLFGFWYQFLFKKPKNGSWTSCCIRCCELTFIICYALRTLSRLLSIRGRSNDKIVLMITLTNSYFLS